jgi:hypothetical protein
MLALAPRLSVKDSAGTGRTAADVQGHFVSHGHFASGWHRGGPLVFDRHASTNLRSVLGIDPLRSTASPDRRLRWGSTAPGMRLRHLSVPFRLVGLRVYAIGARRLTAQGLTDSRGDAYGRERSDGRGIERDQPNVGLRAKARSDHIARQSVGSGICHNGPGAQTATHYAIGDLLGPEQIEAAHRILPPNGDTAPRL